MYLADIDPKIRTTPKNSGLITLHTALDSKDDFNFFEVT